MIHDMLGQLLQPNDVVVDERGKSFLVGTTDPTIAKELQVKAFPLAARGPSDLHVYLVAHLVLRIASSDSPEDNRRLWWEQYRLKVSPQRRQAILDRKKEITGPPRRGMRP